MKQFRPAVLSNGRQFSAAIIEEKFGYGGPLGRMDGQRLFAYAVWHYPADVDPHDLKLDTRNYLQAAGRATRMTLEVRETAEDGSHKQWVLGKQQPLGETAETITWDEYSTQVHPEEVWTAAEAEAVFQHYADTRTVPAGLSRRPIDV